MVPLLFPFFFVLLSSLKFEFFNSNNNGKTILWITLYLYLIVIIGLRYMVGGDSYFYSIYYDNFNTDYLLDTILTNGYQPLFTIITYISKQISTSFISFQVIHALIINTSLFYFIKKNSNYPFTTLFLCFLIFYLNFSVEILRESLAVMVFIFNYKNFEQNKWIRYYSGVLISTLFHLSALFLIFLPFSKFLKLNWKYVIILIICYLLLNKLDHLFVIFENVENISAKINNYSEAYYGWKSSLLFLITRTLIPVSIFLIAKFKYKMTIKYEPLITSLGILGIFSVFNTIIFTRFTNYFLIFYCIAFADVLIQIIKYKKLTISKLIVYGIIIISLVTYGYASFYWPSDYYKKWIPYYSVFSKEAINNKFIDRDY